MGAKDIAKVYKAEKLKQGIYYTSFDDYAGKAMGVDISVQMHRWKYLLPEDSMYFLMRAAQRIEYWLKHNIVPYVVFDGAAPASKIVQVKRAQDRKQKRDRFHEEQTKQEAITHEVAALTQRKHALEDTRQVVQVTLTVAQTDPLSVMINIQPLQVEPAHESVHMDVSRELVLKERELEVQKIETFKRARQHISVRRSDFDALREMLDVLGIVFVVGDEGVEADWILGTWARAGTVDIVLTSDSDLLCHLAPCVVFPMQTGSTAACDAEDDLQAQNEETTVVREYRVHEMLSGLKLNYNQYRDVFILCKCDYCDGLPGVGPVSALKWVRQYGSVEAMLPMEALRVYDEAERTRVEAQEISEDVDAVTIVHDLLQRVDQLMCQAAELFRTNITSPDKIRQLDLSTVYTFWQQYRVACRNFCCEVNVPLVKTPCKQRRWETIVQFFQERLSLSRLQVTQMLPWFASHSNSVVSEADEHELPPPSKRLRAD